MTTTRFAPTLSGYLHLGSLYNAFLNWAYAKINGGRFFLRLDGQNVNPQRREIGEQIIRDLCKFQIVPDKIIWQADRRDVYAEVMKAIVKHPDTYVCTCSEADIAQRGNSGSHPKMLLRPEKYPPPLFITGIKLLDGDKIISEGCNVQVNTSDEYFSIEGLTQNGGGKWKPKEAGDQKELGICELVMDLSEEKNLTGIEIEWGNHEAKEWRVEVSRDKWSAFQTIHETSSPLDFVPMNKAGWYKGICFSKISFPKYRARFIKLVFLRHYIEVKREYVYDQFCRDLDQQFDENAPEIVLRKRCDDFVDVVLWFDRMPDLCLTSAIDDRDFEITHSIRGQDIEPFSLLEAEAGKLIRYQANNLFHKLVVDDHLIKLSKFVDSPKAIDYLSRYSAFMVLKKLCHAARILSDKLNIKDMEIETMDTLISGINFEKVFQSGWFVIPEF